MKFDKDTKKENYEENWKAEEVFNNCLQWWIDDIHMHTKLWRKLEGFI